MLTLLRQRNFSLLWFGGLVSMIGNWVLITALPFYIYEQTGSTLATGLLWIAYFLPGLVFGSVAGVFVDRWDRKLTMVIVNVARTGLILLLLLVRSQEWLWLVYGVAFAESALGQVFAPAESALLPHLVGEEHVVTANALNALNDNVARVIGPAIGGAVMAVFGLRGAVIVDSASFLISALLIMRLVLPAPALPVQQPSERTDAWWAVWREWRAGLRVVRRNQTLFGVFCATGTAQFGDAMLTGLLVPFVNAVAGGGAQALGTILSVRGVAGLIGGLVIGRIGTRVLPHKLLGWSLIVIGAAFAIEVNVPSIPLILTITLLLGVPIIGWLTSQQTLLQTGAPDEFRGRVFGAWGMTNALTGLLGTGLASGLGDVVGIVPLLNVAAGVYAGAGVLALVLLKQRQAVPADTTQQGVPNGSEG